MMNSGMITKILYHSRQSVGMGYGQPKHTQYPRSKAHDPHKHWMGFSDYTNRNAIVIAR